MASQLNRRQALQQVGMGLAGLGLAQWPTWSQAASTSSKIKIGQIGVGHPHANKLGVYRESPDYEVIGLVEPDAELRKRAEKQAVYQGLPWMNREELLSTPGLQAVLVETEVRNLLDNAEACVAAGKHIHLDKPAGASWPQYLRILESAEKQQLLVQMGYMYRYNPAVLLMRQFLQQGWLGEVFEIDAVMSKLMSAESRREPEEFSGGMMFELACHLIDLVVGVLGQPDSVQGYLRHSSPIDDTLMDNTLAVLSYPKATATVRASGVEVDGGQRRHFTLCGTEGTFYIQPLDNPSATITLLRPQGNYQKGTQTITFPKYRRYVQDAADMAKIIRQEKASDFSYDHDRWVQASVLTAAQMSMK